MTGEHVPQQGQPPAPQPAGSAPPQGATGATQRVPKGDEPCLPRPTPSGSGRGAAAGALLPAGRLRTHPRGHAREGARSRRQPRQRGNGDRGRLPNAIPTRAPHPSRPRCPGDVRLLQQRQRRESSRRAGAGRAPKPRAGHKTHKSPPPGHVTVPGAAAVYTSEKAAAEAVCHRAGLRRAAPATAGHGAAERSPCGERGTTATPNPSHLHACSPTRAAPLRLTV